MPYISNLVLPFKTNKKRATLHEQPVFLYIRSAKLCLQCETLVSNISTQKQQVPMRIGTCCLLCDSLYVADASGSGRTMT